MRGSLLNRRAEINRWSLTRLGVDQKWEDERWTKSLESVMIKEEYYNSNLMEPLDVKRQREPGRPKGAKRLKMESGDKVWGEKADHQQEQRGQFLMTGAVITTQLKQSTLPVLKGSEWIAYSLAKEMAWEAVDIAFCMRDIVNWEEWSVPECDSGEHEEECVSVVATAEQTSEGGRAELIIHNKPDLATPLTRVGGGSTTREGGKKNRNSKKNKLPGISASQKSVAAFFKKTEIKKSGSKIGDNMSNSELEKEYRLARAERCKLPWRQDRLCVASVLPVDNSMHE